MFFAPKAKGEGHIVVCVRVESTKGSSDAVALAGKHIIPILLQKGLIKSFSTTQAIPGQAIPGMGMPAGTIISPAPVADTMVPPVAVPQPDAAPARRDSANGN